eukprot:6545157-Pyramimonas_sp.AAC.1
MESCRTTAFYGRGYVDLVERLADRATGGRGAQFPEVDTRRRSRRKVALRDVAMLRGLRPNLPDLRHLSPREFAAFWMPILPSYPTRAKGAEHPRRRAVLTEVGNAESPTADMMAAAVEGN